MIMPTIGIMQGRLFPPDVTKYQVFPSGTWRDEFRIAQEMGFEAIEWLWDAENVFKNPLFDETRIPEIADTAAQYQIVLDSVCADYFRVHGIADGDKNSLRVLETLILHASRVGIKRVIVPLMDRAKIRSEADQVKLRQALAPFYAVLREKKITLCLESDLDANENLKLMKNFDSGCVKIHYDLGNAAGWGFPLAEEIETLKDFIGGIHVKDKNRSGDNVPLGTGIADLKTALKSLSNLGLLEHPILETAMGNNPLAFAKKNLAYLKSLFA